VETPLSFPRSVSRARDTSVQWPELEIGAKSRETTTLPFLVSRSAPHVLPYSRLPFERHVFQVTAAVTEVRLKTTMTYP
jgi:hypothetical protein